VVKPLQQDGLWKKSQKSWYRIGKSWRGGVKVLSSRQCGEEEKKEAKSIGARETPKKGRIKRDERESLESCRACGLEALPATGFWKKGRVSDEKGAWRGGGQREKGRGLRPV